MSATPSCMYAIIPIPSSLEVTQKIREWGFVIEPHCLDGHYYLKLPMGWVVRENGDGKYFYRNHQLYLHISYLAEKPVFMVCL